MSGLEKQGEDRADRPWRVRSRLLGRTAALARIPVAIGITFAFGTLSFGSGALAAGTTGGPTSGPTTSQTTGTAKPSDLKYVVKSGDYLWGIAVKLGVKFGDLLSVNSLGVAAVIVPGQALIVPEGGTLPAEPVVAPPPPYIVAAGDSLTGVAHKLGVKLTELLTANKLTPTSVIHPGAPLIVPAGGKLPAAPPPTPEVSPPAPAASPATQTPATQATATQTGASQSAGAQAGSTQTAPTQTRAAATLPAGYTSYTVLAGDYLVNIAAKNGVTLKALLAANKLITTSPIFPGRALSVPPATLPIPPMTAPAAAGSAVASAASAVASAASAVASAVDSVPVGSASPEVGPAAPTPYEQSMATVLAFLQAQVGKPYVFNTAGPDTYDCSGLVTAAYAQIGIDLPHQSLLQSTKGTAVDWRTATLLPGDLIFEFSSANPTVIGHVGIAIDSTHWIQAAGSTTPIKIGPLPNVDRIQAVRRIVQP